MKDCIAVPVTDAFLCKLEKQFRRHLHHDEILSYDEENKLEGDEWDVDNNLKRLLASADTSVHSAIRCLAIRRRI
jgi:hypothetical protein